MTDSTAAPGGVLTPARTKTLAATLLGAVLALVGALASGGGDAAGVSITTAPHPATVAQIAAIEHRLSAVERRIEEGLAQAALVEGLRSRLDLLLAGARIRLDDDPAPTPRSRR